MLQVCCPHRLVGVMSLVSGEVDGAYNVMFTIGVHDIIGMKLTPIMAPFSQDLDPLHTRHESGTHVPLRSIAKAHGVYVEADLILIINPPRIRSPGPWWLPVDAYVFTRWPFVTYRRTQR